MFFDVVESNLQSCIDVQEYFSPFSALVRRDRKLYSSARTGAFVFLSHSSLVVMIMARWYLVIASSAVWAAYTQAFLDAFSSLGIDPWAGIEMDVAWGHTTLRFGLHRPSVTGPIFVYRVCTSFRQDAPTRMQVLSHADLSPDQLLGAIAGQYPDLRDTWADGGWQLCAIDATRGHSRDRSLMHPCYILVQVDDYWAFNHRPHGLLELVLGSRDLSFPCVLPQMINFPVLQPSWRHSFLRGYLASRFICGTTGLRWTTNWSTVSMVSLYRSPWM